MIMPGRQQIYDIAMAGIAGAATGILHKVKMGMTITWKTILVDTALAACALFVTVLICDVFQLSEEMRRALYFASGWLGSRVIAIVEKNADEKIEKTLDRLTDKL